MGLILLLLGMIKYAIIASIALVILALILLLI